MLGSLFLVTILYTFRNLSGLTIELIAAGTGFVGEDVEFQVRISRPKGKGREGIQLGWLGAIAQWAELYDSEACTRSLVRAREDARLARPRPAADRDAISARTTARVDLGRPRRPRTGLSAAVVHRSAGCKSRGAATTAN